jgi:glycosyltransferase involved in cell wall biosynthesis
MQRRILLLCTDLEVGGVPLLIRNFARVLAAASPDSTPNRSRFTVQVASLAPEGPIAEQIRKHGITTHCLDACCQWDVRVFFRLARLIRQFQPHVLHSQLVHANVVGRLMGSLLGVPKVIATIQTVEKGKRWHNKLENLTCRLSHKTACVSPSVYQHAARNIHIPKSRLQVIPNAIDVDRFADAEPVNLAEFNLDINKTTLVFVGRLDPVKNVDVLLRATARISQGQDIQLLIVGDGPERERLETLTATLNLTDRVRFAGQRLDVERILKAADIFVLPSRWEGMPMAAQEAMASGLPVIASRAEGIIDIIEDNITGLLVTPGSMEQLAHAICRVIQNPTLAQQLSNAAQQKAQRLYSLDSIVQSYSELYTKVNIGTS